MGKKYVVRLTREEREELKALVSKGRASARKIGRAQVLLKVDADGPNWTDQQAADAFGIRANTVADIRERFVEEGLARALDRKRPDDPPRRRKLDGAGEARLIAMACGDPPEGRARWTLRLLAGQMVELEIVDGISHETVRQTLKKNELKPHTKQCWCIPPHQSGEFVAAMEKMFSNSIGNRTIRRGQSCAWTRRTNSWSAKLGFPFRPITAGPDASTTNTRGAARPTSSCSPSPLETGGALM